MPTGWVARRGPPSPARCNSSACPMPAVCRRRAWREVRREADRARGPRRPLARVTAWRRRGGERPALEMLGDAIEGGDVARVALGLRALVARVHERDAGTRRLERRAHAHGLHAVAGATWNLRVREVYEVHLSQRYF